MNKINDKKDSDSMQDTNKNYIIDSPEKNNYKNYRFIFKYL